ncbi:MAG TPA: C1 family peptidase, partial [Ferruginibacter sp.]|nr:C1 family peptidase [Ferruginibacter sp.]
MKKYLLLPASFVATLAVAQSTPPLQTGFTLQKSIAVTPVKNQAMTGTCWCFSSTSMIESQCLKKNVGELDISEMFTVRNIYI